MNHQIDSTPARYKTILLAGLALGACLGAAGCAVNEAHQRGKRLMAAGEYDEAVVVLREVVTSHPNEGQYHIDLAEAETQAAEQHIQAAEKLLAENQATPARDHLATAQEQVPAHPKARRLLEETQSRVEAGERLSREASEALSAQKWAEAYRLASEAVQADAGNPQSQLMYGEARSAAAAHGVPTEAVAARPSPPTVDRPPAMAQARPREPARRPPEASRERSESSRRRDRARRERPSDVPPPPPPPPVQAPPEEPEQWAQIPAAFRGILSRDDDRYPKSMETLDEIVVKLEDTDHDPLNADITIRVGKYVLKRKHVRVRMPVYGRGASGRSYRIYLEGINPDSETVRFVVEAVMPTAPASGM